MFHRAPPSIILVRERDIGRRFEVGLALLSGHGKLERAGKSTFGDFPSRARQAVRFEDSAAN
jgi:hypothetical protein